MYVRKPVLTAFAALSALVATAAADAPLKVLYLGNSMTIHGPSPKIGWTNSWGMAASAREKDYVHIVARGIEAKTGRKVDIRVKGIADFERNLADFDMAGKFAADRAWGADYTIIAIGENSPVPKTPEEQALFKTKMLELNRMFAPKDGRDTVVRGVFSPCMVKDRLQREAAAEAGVKYVRTWDLGATKECKAIGKFWHSGVAGHPGDKGMALMAERILDAFFPPPGLPIEWKGERLAEWKKNRFVESMRLENGMLAGTVTGIDGNICARLKTPFETRNNQFFKLRMKASRGGTAQLFWMHQGVRDPSEKFSTMFEIECDGAWHDYKVRPRWMGPEKIAALRFDFPTVFAGGATFEIAEIAVVEEGEAIEPFFADESNFVAFSLKAPPGINYYALEWSSSKKPVGGIHFTTPPDGETHEYAFNLWQGWWGGIVNDFKVCQPFAGKDLQVGNLRFQKEKPVLPPDPVITSAIPSEAVPRAGRPFVLEAVVRNFGTVVAKNLKFTFDGLPTGVMPLEPDALSPKEVLPGSNGAESLNNPDGPQLPHERVFRFRLSDLGAGRHVFGLSLAADGVAPRRTEVVADVKSSLGLAKLDYPAEPKPVDTSPYEIGALMFPGWVSKKWHTVWSHDHARKPVLGWYDETNPETVDWQIKHLVENGISFVSVCWYWRNGKPSRNHWMEAFNRARYNKYLKWHIMWDNGYNSLEDQRKLAHYWCEKYFAHPQYHKIDGKPVVAICGPDAMEQRALKDGGAKRLLDMTREIARSYGFPGVYFVAMRGMGRDWEDPTFLKQFADYGFDVTTVYGFRGGIPGSEEFDSRQRTYSSLAKLSLPHWRALHKNGTIPFWPSISTGYDDRPWRGERVLEIRGYNASDFARICRDARKFSDESGVRTFLLGPLDEWGEGSIGYPNHAHGFGIFEAVRETFGRKPADGWPVNYAPEDVGLVCPQRELAPASSDAKAAQSDAERMGSEMMNPGRGIGMSETAQGGDFKEIQGTGPSNSACDQGTSS